MLEPWSLFVLVLGGCVAGMLNTLAGAGSMVNVLLLSWVGLPHSLANASNRVAVLAQSATATVHFRRSGLWEGALVRSLLIPMLAGAAAGAFFATQLQERFFRPLAGVELLILGLLLLWKPKLWLQPEPSQASLSPWARRALFFFVGVYAGFLQVGVGFFLMAALVQKLGMDLVRASALKVVLTAATTLLALCIFLSADMVVWTPALVLAAGNGLGGWLGAHLAVKKGAPWIRWILVVTVFISALQMLGAGRLLEQGLRSAD